MSKAISQEIKKIAKLIMESVSVEDYSAEDFIEVAVIYFRDWVKEKYGDTISKYPISYLNKKYGEELIDDFTSKFNTYRGSLITYNKLINFKALGIELVKNSLYSFVDVSENKSWFDSKVNVKIWEKMVKYLRLPSYLTLNVVETRPRNIEVKGNIDFNEFIRSNEPLKYDSIISLVSSMISFLKKYFNQSFGNPAHGELQIAQKNNLKDYDYVGFYEWEKNVFNKKIKPEIKKLPIAPYIRTIVCKLESSYYSTRPEITVHAHRNTSFTKKSEIENQINLYLTNNGYNPKHLVVHVK